MKCSVCSQYSLAKVDICKMLFSRSFDGHVLSMFVNHIAQEMKKNKKPQYLRFKELLKTALCDAEIYTLLKQTNFPKSGKMCMNQTFLCL